MTREEFEAAVRVVKEGRPAHSMYAVEDARAVLKSVARYHWRQTTILVMCCLWPALAAPSLLPGWPWFAAYFAGGIAGSLIASAVIRAPLMRPLLAPAGLSAGDVAEAFHHVHT